MNHSKKPPSVHVGGRVKGAVKTLESDPANFKCIFVTIFAAILNAVGAQEHIARTGFFPPKGRTNET